MKTLIKMAMILALFIHSGYGQNELTNFIPRSPEAAKISRFGQVPLNASTGQMNFSVPIANIEVAGNSWPVTLNYNYGGLLLEGKPSLLGLGWNLFANGAVNREVRGLPDESLYGYYGSQHKRALINTYIQNGNDASHLTYIEYDNFLNNRYDGQPDKYTVNVADLNFSFKVDVNQNPVFLSKHDNIVNLTWVSTGPGGSSRLSSIEVIDDKGITYTFGAVEESLPDDELQYDFAQVDLSWLLTEIKYPNQQKITFGYVSDQHTTYNFSASGTATYSVVDDPLNDPNAHYSNPGYQENTAATIINRKILTSINYPAGSIELNRTLREQERDVYSSIEVKNSQTATIDLFNFTYQGNRDALISIQKNGIDYYGFRYFGINEPDEFSSFGIPDFLNSESDVARDKDKWQYYNGAGNQFALGIPNSSFTADNEPSFPHTKLGAMTRITYPTKGYTRIYYERNEVKTQNLGNSDYYNTVALSSNPRILRVDGQQGVFGAPATKDEEMRIVVTEPMVAIISHETSINFNSGTGHFFMSMYREDGGCPYTSYYPEDFAYPVVETDYDTYADALRAKIQTYNSTTPDSNLNPNVPPICPKFAFEIGPDGPYAAQGGIQSVVGDSGGRILLIPGTYVFNISTLFNNTTDGFAEFSVFLQRDLSGPPPYVNEPVGGLRVSKTENYTAPGSLVETQHYEYNDSDGFSTGVLNLVPLNKQIGSITAYYNSQPSVTYTEFYNYLFESYTAFNPSIGTPVYYNQIKRYKENENTYGNTITSYAYTGLYNTPAWHRIPQGEHFNKGRVVSVLTNRGSTQSPIITLDTLLLNRKSYNQKRDLLDLNTQQDQNPNHPPSLIVSVKQNRVVRWDLYNYSANASQGSQEMLEIMKLSDFIVYKELDSWYQLGSETAIDYSGEQPIQTTKFYKYQDDDFLKLTSTQSVDHSAGEMYITRYTYPEDVPSEPFMSDLIAKNQVTIPVKTDNYILPKNATQEVLLQSTTTVFDDFPTNQGVTMILPKISKTKKAGAQEQDRIVYDSYDIVGNITQYRKEDGPPISLIWGYNNLYPVAKIENATYNDVTAISFNSAVLQDVNSTDAQKQAELDKIRNGLPGAMVSTYTYLPGVGISSTTDPRGNTTNYSYDSLNRLKEVKDTNGHLLQDYQYNYKN